MGFGWDGSYNIGLDGAINLDLLDARLLVTIDHRARLCGRVRADHAELGGAIFINRSGLKGVRPHTAPLFERLAHRPYEIELVADIAHGGHACRQVDWPPFHLLVVRVHVPQTRQQGLAPRINDCGILWNFDLRSWPG